MKQGIKITNIIRVSNCKQKNSLINRVPGKRYGKWGSELVAYGLH